MFSCSCMHLRNIRTISKCSAFQAPSEMGTFVAQTGTIGTNTDLLIKWLRILRNLYKAIREDCITQESLGFTAKNSADGTVFNELQVGQFVQNCYFYDF